MGVLEAYMPPSKFPFFYLKKKNHPCEIKDLEKKKFKNKNFTPT